MFLFRGLYFFFFFKPGLFALPHFPPASFPWFPFLFYGFGIDFRPLDLDDFGFSTSQFGISSTAVRFL